MKTLCEHCHKEIRWNMASVSMNRFRKYLCIDGQIEEIKKTYPPELAKLSIQRLQSYQAH